MVSIAEEFVPETTTAPQGGYPEVVAVADWTEQPNAEQQAFARDAIESGRILLFPERPFALKPEEYGFFDPAIVKTIKKTSAKGRPRIIYFRDKDKLLKAGVEDDTERAALRAMMVRYSDWARNLLLEMLPGYERGLQWGPTSFRPNSRKLQRMHVDAFFVLPTQGRRVLRIFTNVNPNGVPRSWDVSETFGTFAPRHAHRLKPESLAEKAKARALSLAHLTIGRQTAYDHAMLQMRKFAKDDKDFNGMERPQTVSFPTGATWICYTDAVLHAGRSGQHAFEQTFMLHPDIMYYPERSPLRVLENLTGRRLS